MSPETNPDEVTTLYTAVRKHSGMERTRRITHKQDELALLVAEHRPGHTWRELPWTWNRSHHLDRDSHLCDDDLEALAAAMDQRFGELRGA